MSLRATVACIGLFVAAIPAVAQVPAAGGTYGLAPEEPGEPCTVGTPWRLVIVASRGCGNSPVLPEATVTVRLDLPDSIAVDDAPAQQFPVQLCPADPNVSRRFTFNLTASPVAPGGAAIAGLATLHAESVGGSAFAVDASMPFTVVVEPYLESSVVADEPEQDVELPSPWHLAPLALAFALLVRRRR